MGTFLKREIVLGQVAERMAVEWSHLVENGMTFGCSSRKVQLTEWARRGEAAVFAIAGFRSACAACYIRMQSRDNR